MGRVFFNTRKNVHNLTAAYQVLSSDSGKVFTIDQDATFVITLPSSHLEGENFKFIVTDAGSGEVHITSGGAAGIKGFSMDPTTGINAVSNVLVEIVASTAVVGDYVNLVSDGTTWWCDSISSATNGIVGADS